MKIIKSFALAAGLAALAACGGETTDNTVETTDANMMASENLTVDANNVTIVNEGANAADMNASADMNGMDHSNMDMNATNNAM